MGCDQLSRQIVILTRGHLSTALAQIFTNNFNTIGEDGNERHLWNAFEDISLLDNDDETADLFGSIIDEVNKIPARDNNVIILVIMLFIILSFISPHFLNSMPITMVMQYSCKSL